MPTFKDWVDAARKQEQQSALDEIRQLNAIDALDLIVERYGIAFVLSVLIERHGLGVVRGAVNRIAELKAQVQPVRGES